METKLETFCVEGFKGRRNALATILFDRASGEVYVHCAAFGGATETALCAAYDGVAVAAIGTNVYVPASWVRRERAHDDEFVALLDKVVKRTREAAEMSRDDGE